MMKNRSLYGFILAGLIYATPALSQNCDLERFRLADAQTESATADSAYNNWESSYNYNVNVIYSTFYAVSSGCGTSATCLWDAEDNRRYALDNLDNEGINLWNEKFDKQFKLEYAQSDLALCVELFES